MDRILAMRTFCAVAKSGSFTAAADQLELSPQLVSKYVSQLEHHLGVRLLNRTTRRVHMTEAGERYLTRALFVLDEIEDMENVAGESQQEAKGRLRISAPVSFGVKHLSSLFHDFQQANAGVTIDCQLNDRKVDIIEEGFDIALRVGQLKDSSLIAKKLATVRICICASPSYLRRYGTPTSLEDLKSHRYLRYSYLDPTAGLSAHNALCESDENNFICNNGDTLSQMAVQGAGIALQPTFICGEALANGELVEILPELAPPDLGLFAIYAHRQLLASKVRTFLDFADGYFGSPPYWDAYKADSK
ncbi:LysR family transcriptional regulator [Alteromonas sp. H39]|uniref:LysR family transcriptional regulator n=1 Tax=Alteromonas sp. H39 TaxID=3389876 RepID=UPI0039DF39B7